MINETIPCFDALLALAFMGDLSMGQPIDHSTRVAWLARRLAEETGHGAEECQDVSQVALLRWVGCTANAVEVAEVISDDVHGRAAMLASRPQAIGLLIAPQLLAQRISHISAIHCEISALIAQTLGLRSRVRQSLACLFETWDGCGYPAGLAGDAIPWPVLLVLLAGDMEIFSREYGVPAAIAHLRQRAGVVYPHDLVELAGAGMARWLDELDRNGDSRAPIDTGAQDGAVSLSLLADAIDLKIPWLTGHSRAVERLAVSVAESLDMPVAAVARMRRAGLLHGLGRVAVANSIWNVAGPLSSAQWEQVRLCPYWTARAASQIPSLAEEADIAAFAYERLDGSGYFRAARHASTPLDYRILPVVTTWLALRAPRPWRAPLPLDAAVEHLRRQVSLGRFDPAVVDALVGASSAIDIAPHQTKSVRGILTPRETDVLRCISLGSSNKMAARALCLSPSTVRTHIESVFRKLECNSRAAATLKASLLGLL